LEVVATVIYLLNFYSGSSTCPAAAWIIHGCGAVVKMTQLRLRSCWLSWVWLRLRSSFFHDSGSSSGFWSFSDISILFTWFASSWI